jgi:hypothetical protein
MMYNFAQAEGFLGRLCADEAGPTGKGKNRDHIKECVLSREWTVVIVVGKVSPADSSARA